MADGQPRSAYQFSALGGLSVNGGQEPGLFGGEGAVCIQGDPTRWFNVTGNHAAFFPRA